MRFTAFLLVAGLFAAPAIAQQPEADAQARARYDAMPDTAGSGPRPAIKEADPSFPNHVVYRPADPGGDKLGVLIWGNGGCRDDGASARQHLAEIASYGYVAIAPGTIASGPGAPPARRETRQLDAEGRMPPVRTTTADVVAGLDWILAENARPGSRYFGRIDTAQIAAAGHSCGGVQAIQAGADPRIRSVIVHNSGIFTDGRNPLTGMTVSKAQLNDLHTPILYILGGKSDIAWENGMDDVRRINHTPVVLLDLDVGHGGTFREPRGGAVAQVAVQWLNWQLRQDKSAAAWFAGANCGLCQDAQWKVERKGIR